ncbi:MAG: T9SS type A sorting domain-containing protein [Bacteriovoracaceae bacterium]|nr:T9SS type A sorting domain-containing protein [Bacteroidota bacterium]
MVKKLFTLFLLSAFCLTAFAGERVLLRIGENGKQEAIPLKKGESAKTAIERLEKQRASYYKASNSAGLIDTLKNYTSDADLTVNFGWTHQDVAFQWFVPPAGGSVKEFWWSNYLNRGVINKGTIRAWHVDSRVAKFAASPATNYLGAYKDLSDGDGGVQPFKPATGDQWFYSNGKADSVTYSFDMFSKEAAWFVGGLQVTLDSNVWQGIKMEDWGDSLNVNPFETFGFTLSNDTKLSDIGAGADTRMEILSAGSAGAPYHSFKYYETGRSGPADAGWHLRGDYEWGMYVVIEYTTDRAPKIVSLDRLFTTLKTTSRVVNAVVTDDNPGGGPAGVDSVRLYAKIGKNGAWQVSAMTGAGSTYTGTLPGANPNDTVSYYIKAYDVNKNMSESSVYTYTIFKKVYDILFVWNGRNTGNNSLGTLGAYNMRDTVSEPRYYDIWDVASYGTADIPDLYNLYTKAIFEYAGDGGKADLTGKSAAWLSTATPSSKKVYFMADQDHGFISKYLDTTFLDDDPHAKYFGVKSLINQDYPYYAAPTEVTKTNPWRIFPDKAIGDDVFGYIPTYMASKGVTYWYNIYFEVSSLWANWMDELEPTASAKVLFRDSTYGNKPIAVRNSAADGSWHTFYFAFEPLGTNFRSDTSVALYDTIYEDPGYAWIFDVNSKFGGSYVNNILKLVTSVSAYNGIVPEMFSLSQNYPNPFNPTTEITYNVPMNSSVEIAVYNLLGQKVRTLINEVHAAGEFKARWDGKDASGKSVSSGVYFYTMKAGSFQSVKKMMLLK